MVNTLLPPTPLVTRQNFSCRELIRSQSNVLWQIEQGIVQTSTWNEDGSTVILGYWGSGDVVGSALSQAVPYQLQCLTSVEASILPSELWNQALEAILLHAQQLEEIFRIRQTRTVSKRLWEFLLWLAQKFGREVEQGRLIDVPLTHEELGETIGTARVFVTRILQQFEKEGLLLRHKRRLVLLSSGLKKVI